jgi:hypothetical protein
MILNELFTLSELSPDTLASYKKKAGADASAADAAGDYARGNKRFKGIVKATKKQFANDTKGVAEGAAKFDPKTGLPLGQQISEFGGDATQFGTPTQSTPTTEQPPRRGYSIILTGKPGRDWMAEYAWQALEKVFPREYPGNSSVSNYSGDKTVTPAMRKVLEVANRGSAVAKTGITSEDIAETLVAKLAVNRVPAQYWRITSEDLDEGVTEGINDRGFFNNVEQWHEAKSEIEHDDQWETPKYIVVKNNGKTVAKWSKADSYGWVDSSEQGVAEAEEVYLGGMSRVERESRFKRRKQDLLQDYALLGKVTTEVIRAINNEVFLTKEQIIDFYKQQIDDPDLTALEYAHDNNIPSSGLLKGVLRYLLGRGFSMFDIRKLVGKAAEQKKKEVAESGEKDRQWSNKDMERLRVATRDFDDILSADGPEAIKQELIKKRIKTKPMAGPKGVLPEQGVAEGLPQTLRKVVPGYAKREIDKKMDAGKFGKTDADKDANFQRYKKIQDKLKEQGVAEGANSKVSVTLNGQPIGHIERDTVADDDGVIGYVGVVYDGTARPYTLHGYEDRNELKHAIADVYRNRVAKKGVAEGSSSHAELAQMAYDAYVAATRKGNGPMAAHYLKQHLKHKADAAKAKSGVAEGLVKGEYGRVLDALQLYYPRLSMEELNVPGYHKVVADKANVPVEYAARVINDFARDNDPDEDEFGDFNDDEQGVAEGEVAMPTGQATGIDSQTNAPPSRSFAVKIVHDIGRQGKALIIWNALEDILPRDYPRVPFQKQTGNEPQARVLFDLHDDGFSIVKQNISSQDVAETIANKFQAKGIAAEVIDGGIYEEQGVSEAADNELQSMLKSAGIVRNI